MKTGTLGCRWFGHKFIEQKKVYDPHYLKLSEQGLVLNALEGYDYAYKTVQSDYCVRCGIDADITMRAINQNS